MAARRVRSHFAGPKDYNRLVALGGHQEELMDFGTRWILLRLLACCCCRGGLLLSTDSQLRHRNYSGDDRPEGALFWPIQARASVHEADAEVSAAVGEAKEKYKDDPPVEPETMKLTRSITSIHFPVACRWWCSCRC
jgi:hypothetical protein